MRVRDDSGQASIEHLGLVALIALVLLAAGAITAVAAPGLENRVTTAMQQALCTVAGQRCPTLERQPCPVLRTERTLAGRIALGVIRLGDDRALTIERRSDGTYVISLVEGLGAGKGLAVDRGAASAAAEGMLTARAGRTYTAPDRATAAALVERLRRKKLPGAEAILRGAADLAGLAGSEPDVQSYTVSGRAAGEATAKLGLGSILEGGGKVEGGVEVGVTIAAHRQEATAYVALDGRVSAFFDVLPGAQFSSRGRGRGPGKSGGDEASASVVNPGKLDQTAEALTGGTVALHLAPGPKVTEVEITGMVSAGGTRRELHVRIDPSDPDVAAALAAWRSHPTDPQVLQALGRAAAGSAAIDERTYRTAHHDTDHGGTVSAGPIELGASLNQGLRTSELIEQRTRPVGGVWERRLDCEAA